jgi:hypothetical protein
MVRRAEDSERLMAPLMGLLAGMDDGLPWKPGGDEKDGLKSGGLNPCRGVDHYCAALAGGKKAIKNNRWVPTGRVVSPTRRHGLCFGSDTSSADWRTLGGLRVY